MCEEFQCHDQEKEKEGTDENDIHLNYDVIPDTNCRIFQKSKGKPHTEI